MLVKTRVLGVDYLTDTNLDTFGHLLVTFKHTDGRNELWSGNFSILTFDTFCFWPSLTELSDYVQCWLKTLEEMLWIMLSMTLIFSNLIPDVQLLKCRIWRTWSKFWKDLYTRGRFYTCLVKADKCRSNLNFALTCLSIFQSISANAFLTPFQMRVKTS